MTAKSDNRAVGLYVVAARDFCDFIDMVEEEQDLDALKTLHAMLTLRGNPKTDQKLNDLAAPVVTRELQRRGVVL